MVQKLQSFVLIILFPVFLFSQERNYWEKTNSNNIPDEDVIEYSGNVGNPIYYNLDENSIFNFLSNAPDRYESANTSILLSIPNPEGKMDTFEIFSTQTMARELAESLPEVKSYVGRNVSNKSHSLRITITPEGFFGMTIGSKHGQTFINPFARNSNSYMVFSKNNITNNSLETFYCEVVEDQISYAQKTTSGTPKFIEDGELKKYRLGVATTVEYSNYHWQAAGLLAGESDAAKKDAVQAAIVVSVDRVNQIYERDLGVTLELIPNNQDVIFLGAAASDPYTNNDGGAMLAQNQTTFNNIIGSANYDMGHVYSTGGGGIASLNSVCSSNKARGVTGQGNPVGDLFDIDYVAHEMGHQFGANHTQNNACNRNGPTAMEPGSANTIMGYAGICSPNVQSNSDAMFHYISISEISNGFNGITGSCAELITIANSAPTVQPVANFEIPQNTPFMLEADVTDAEGDALTYSWEQIDNQVATMPPTSTATGGPSFRTFLPSDSPVRYFPSMNTLLNNNYSNTWEVLPTVNRTLNFGVIVRDNNIFGGQVSSETTALTVNASAGPFRVTSQNTTGIVWAAGNTETITWNVANTNNVSGVNSQIVDILLSADGGQNFDVVLASNTPNDGSENITVPNSISANARIMVRAADNVFFDLNTGNIQISGTPPSCVAPQDVVLDNISTNTSDISWTASVSNPSNGYDYVLVTDGSIPNGSTSPTGNVGTGITSVNLTSLTSNTTYDVYVRANCGSGDLSDWSNPLNFRTLCTAIIAPLIETFDGTNWLTGTAERIDECWSRTPTDPSSNYAWKVNSNWTPTEDTGPIDDVTGGGNYIYTEATGYNQGDIAYLNTPSIDLSTLTTPRIKLSYHMFGSDMGSLSVEVKEISASTYNTEFTLTGQQQTANADLFLETFIDLSAYAGQTIDVRFVSVRGSDFNSDIGIDQFSVEETPTCPAPLNLSISNLTSSSVDLSWSAVGNPSNGYQYVLITDGSTPDAITTPSGSVSAGVTSTNITGLTSNTDYDVYVRANCGAGDLSSWSGPLSLKTPCGTIIAPLIETFDGTDWVEGATANLGECWTRSPEDVSLNYGWRVNTGSTASSSTGPTDDVTVGGKYLYTEATNYSVDDEAVLNTPPIDLSALTIPIMKISYHMFGSSMGSLSVEVKEISASTYSTVFTISGQQQAANSDPFIEQPIDLSAFSGDTVNIRIVALRGPGFTSDIAVDQFVIEELGCLTPINLSTSNLTLNSVDLSWDATINESNGYEWVVMASGVTPDPGNAIATGTTSSGTTTAEVSGLIVNTNYDAYVRSDCGSGDLSEWSILTSFFIGYCDSQGNNQADEYIGNVQFGSIDNTSADENGGYSDFTAISTLVVTGQDYPISITPIWTGTIYPEGYAVWIDFNHNESFEDAGELVFSQSPTQSTPVTGTISIPNTALGGETRMRVSMKYNAVPTSCEVFTFGEVEDYTVVIYDDYVYYDNAWTPGDPSNGVSTSADNILAINGETSLTGTTLANSLTIQGGAKLNVAGVLNLSGNLDNDGSLVFKSDVTGTAQLDQFAGTVSGSGEVTAERYIPAGLPDLRRAFRFLSSSVNSSGSINANWQEDTNNTGTNFPTDNQNPNPGFGTHITGGLASDGFDQNETGTASMFTFDNTNQNGNATQDDDWTAIPNTNSKTLKAGEAYLTFIRGDRSIDVTSNSATPTNTTLRASGDLHIGPRSFSSANNSITPEYGLSNQADFYSLVGNPYQAIVDANNLDFTNVKSNFYWVWDANLGSQGQYTTVSLPSGLNTTTSSANQFVQPGQSFFVQTIADGAASITFNEDDKNTSGGATTIFSEQNEPSIHLLLYTTDAFNTGAKESDGTLINFSDNANNALDLFDADKFLGPGENLARLHSNELISIENRGMPTDNEILALSTTGYTEDNYIFVVNASNIQSNFEAYLLDNYTGTQTQLNEGLTQINFSVDANIPASSASDRFSLVFDNTTLGVNENSFGSDFSLYPNPTNDGRFIIKTKGLSGEDVNIKIHNILGQQVLSQNLRVESNGDVNVESTGLTSGVYVVELLENEKSFTAKLIVE